MHLLSKMLFFSYICIYSYYMHVSYNCTYLISLPLISLTFSKKNIKQRLSYNYMPIYALTERGKTMLYTSFNVLIP